MDIKVVAESVASGGFAVSGVIWIISKLGEDIITSYYDLKERQVDAKHRAERIAKYPAKRSLKSLNKGGR